MILYDYPRSSACYRVRIALKLKQCVYERVEVHLINEGGQQHHASYQAINPQELVPSLDLGTKTLTQSLAIIEYLDERFPNPALLPPDPVQKAQIRSLALLIACDLHPLNNLRVLNRLKQQFNADEAQVQAWYHHWLQLGFDAFESLLKQGGGPFCFGDEVSLADVCLIPQVLNARRFHFEMDPYPLISAVNDHCLKLEAFAFEG
jgi:maleylacetoacetate isomerase